jgi:secreted trypsin-like serine protease
VFRRSLVLGLFCSLMLPVSAEAIIGGKVIRRSSAPWFANVGICGGTLIAPDRVATAAHCIDPIDLGDFESVKVGTQVRRGVRVALPATWREQRSGFAADDVAIVQLDRPVSRVRPVRLMEASDRLPARVHILGMGQTQLDGPSGHTSLRRATLKTVRDADCERRWKRSRAKLRNRFRAASEVCAIDADGRAPLDSVCNGDSGGPIIAGTLEQPVLVGIISWAGECGADKLPTVGEETAHYRDFLAAAQPVWAPVPDGPTRATLSGSTLTCELPTWSVAPDEVDVRWQRRVRRADGYTFVTVSRDMTYATTARDRGQLLGCQALGSNPGGRTLTPIGPDSRIRVPR